MKKETPKFLNDLPPNTIIKVYWKENVTHRPNPQKFKFLGISGNKEIMEKYANKKQLTQAFGIIAEPIDGDKTIKEGKVIPECLFPETIKLIDADI